MESLAVIYVGGGVVTPCHHPHHPLPALWSRLARPPARPSPDVQACSEPVLNRRRRGATPPLPRAESSRPGANPVGKRQRAVARDGRVGPSIGVYDLPVNAPASMEIM